MRVEEVEPTDEHNQDLVENTHPPDWTNPEPAERYNVVVIGAGTAGLVSASGAAGLGAKVALVERDLFGGDCLNVGCVPSKCLIRSSRVAHEARNTDQFGVSVAGVEVDFPAVMERVRRLRARISRHDAVQKFVNKDIDVFLGEGRFVGPHCVEVGEQRLDFDKAVIATGSRPRQPDIKGIEQAGYLTNETIFSLTERPDRLLVIGGGPLGCELAQAMQRLGSRVCIAERASQFLRREDTDAARILAESFQRDGIDVMLDTQARRVSRDGEDRVVQLVTDGKERTIRVDDILVGIGRQPNVEDLNLEAAGIEYTKRHGVEVDDRLRTTNHDVFAAGDVCLKYKFTHTADAAARIVVQNALFWGRKKFSAQTIPWCTYTDPEIAHVGMYEHQAEERGIEVATFTQPLEDVDRAVADGEEEGFVKVHVRKGSDEILGATVVARHAGEMLSEITTAMNGDVGLAELAHVIHPYPTQAEAIRHTADAYNRTRLTPLAQKLTSSLMSWRR
jgi:pyruvate/2-oxoglutarate dehydrogenase complex dihydrolipoamide dehydrogenase (E3) component